MNVAERLSEITNAAIAEQKSEAARQQTAEQEKLIRERDDATKWAQDRFPKVLSQCREAANLGKRSILFSIADFEDDVTDRTVFRLKSLMILVEKEGFTAKAKYSQNDPCGSDSYFTSTVYSTSLSISW